MDWRRVIETFPSRLIEGEGFAVRVYERYGARYYEHGRELTLLTDNEDATDRYGRSLRVFPTIETQIYVPNCLAWDDGARVSESESAIVIQRICHVFQKVKPPVRVILRDDIYNQADTDPQEGERQF